jgi:FMN phosphatase YigB (HAD superfamily)
MANDCSQTLRVGGVLKAIMFDFGHTTLPENSVLDPTMTDCPPDLMPGVREALSAISLPMGIWANTRETTSVHIREWLRRAGLDRYIRWIVTSSDVGYRKPQAEFFIAALAECNLKASDVLFVGINSNTDIIGAQSLGIATCRLSIVSCWNTRGAMIEAAMPAGHQPLISAYRKNDRSDEA